MDKMLNETVKTIRNHPAATHFKNDYYHTVTHYLKLEDDIWINCTEDMEGSSHYVTYPHISYWRSTDSSYNVSIQWDEDACVTFNDFYNPIQEKTAIDPELAYFQIMTDIKEKAATKDDQESF